MPKRPCEIESMVTAMRAAKAGGTVSTATEANSWMRLVTAASPAINVKNFEVVVPELRWPAKAAQFDHRQGKVEAIALGLLRHLAI